MSEIAISNNTIIKLLIRRGSNSERANVILAEGELGYTVDTKRVFIGDGVTPGGRATGSKFLGSTSDITSPSESALIGDYIFKSDTYTLYRLQTGDGTSLDHWQAIAGPEFVQVDGQTIVKDNNNIISVGAISASDLSSSLFNGPVLIESNFLTLSSEIAVNEIKRKNSASLSLPSTITFKSNAGGTTTYNFPAGGSIYTGYHLITDGSGNLSWAPNDRIATGNTYINNVSVPVGTIVPYVSKTLTDPTGWFFCDGRLLAGSSYKELSAVIGNTFGGSDIQFRLPNLMPGKIPFGINASTEALGTEYKLLTGVNITTTVSGASALSLASSINTLSAFGTYYIIKWLPESAFTKSQFEMSVIALTANGLSAYNQTLSASTITAGPSGQFSLRIPPGDIGTGNPAVVEAFQRARAPKMASYTVPGTYEYIVPNNTYRIKVTATGGGGHGYVKYDVSNYKADGTNGGAGSTVIAYIDTVPGESFKAVVGSKGLANRTTRLEINLSATGWGGATTFGLSSNSNTIYTDLCARGALGGYEEYGTDKMVDALAGGYARGGFKGGIAAAPNESTRVSSYVRIDGGDGGNFFNTSYCVGAASYWGSGPAPGGGGSGWSSKTRAGETIAEAGNGIITIEAL